MKMVRSSASLLLLVMTNALGAQLPPSVHSLDTFARNVFETYRQGDFDNFYQSTIFALGDERFKRFMLQVRNDDIRNSLTKGEWSQWQKKLDPEKAEAAWAKACFKEWRKPYRRLQEIGPSAVRHEAFENIQIGAEKEGIRSLSPPHKWETSRLTAVEVLHNVSADNKHFKIDGIESPVLNWEPGLTYRLQFDLTTHGHPFRFSPTSDGPIVYERGVTRETHGNEDLVIRLEKSPRALHYFCSNQKNMGNQIDFSVGKKHLKRNVLLTFTHGNPQRLYRILLRDCLPIPPASVSATGSAWNQWLLFDRPVWLGPVRKEPSPE